MKTNKKIIAIVAVVALVAILGVCLMACNADSYTKKLEKKGYTVSNYTVDKKDEGKIEWGVFGTKKGSGLIEVLSVTIVKYKSTDDAKKAEADKKSILGEGSVERSGKIVFWGSAQAIKDAK